MRVRASIQDLVKIRNYGFTIERNGSWFYLYGNDRDDFGDYWIATCGTQAECVALALDRIEHPAFGLKETYPEGL